MTGAELAAEREAIGWTKRQLADQLRCDERRVRRWEAGVYPIPGSVARWVSGLAAVHRANPAPVAQAVPAAAER